ncbi:unnamed protein product [Arctia plantaginis]|uniref:Histidine-rich glycoprotein-like n=1 Tax=Arctia plantaginis TaxID=874455 RepID=A0A8S1AE02_ARCPL|nr:unnamed protein product [Arctia plantaginis]
MDTPPNLSIAMMVPHIPFTYPVMITVTDMGTQLTITNELCLILVSQILLITAVVATVCARPQEGHDHIHGHAYSSQSIVLHQAHETKHEPHHNLHHQEHEEHHKHEEHKENEHHGHHEQHVDYYVCSSKPNILYEVATSFQTR